MVFADLPPNPLTPVEVTAPRLPDAPGDAAYDRVLLDQAHLADADRLDQALTRTPGVSLFRRTSSLGANPTTQGVSVRAIAGSGASRALATLDGVPQNDPFGGWVVWSGLAATEIKSAAITRGAGAGPYGSGALTGVIALRQADPGADQGRVTAGFSGAGGARIGAGQSMAVGTGVLDASGAYETSDGWTPIQAGRGAADQPLRLEAKSAQLRYLTDLGPVAAAARLAVYSERRGAGLVGAQSVERGVQSSLTLARQPSDRSLGWRLQGWVSASNLFNSSVSTPAGRAVATPANTQYDTPATGYGVNAALRFATGGATLEAGGDMRAATGESHEQFRYLNGGFTRDRTAGGDVLTAGLYLDATVAQGPWLATGGLRLDHWSQSGAHRTERDAATGATTLFLNAPDRSGLLPTARAGLKRDLADGLFVRGAAYIGFRAPTLNELHRPFRVGNDVTEANPELKPERLSGAELGLGGTGWGLDWTGNLFVNRLSDAVANVTRSRGPITDSVAGFIPAGGVLRQRQNIQGVDAYGLELSGRRPLGRYLDAELGAVFTHARMDGGGAAPGLTGLKPAETPAASAHAGLTATPLPDLTVSADLVFESARYDDDQNLRRLRAGASGTVRLAWRLDGGGEIFVAADNLGRRWQTARDASGLTANGPSAVIRVGMILRH